MNHHTSKAHQLFQYSVVALAFTIPLSIAAYTAVSALLLILWVIEGNWRYKWETIKNQPFFKAMLLFYLFMVLSLIWTDNYAQGLKHLRKWYYLILLLPILYTSIDRRWIPQIFNTFLAAMIISEILSYLIFFDLMPFKYKPTWSSIDPSPFMHHTPYSIFLIFTIFLMATRLLTTERTKVQLFFYSFFILTMTANLFLNAGRTGQFILLLALGIFITTYWRIALLKTSILSVVIALCVFVPAYFLSPNFHNRTNETYTTFHHLIVQGEPLSDSTGFRFMMWQTAGNIIYEHPWIGVGIGDERDMYQQTLETKLPNLKSQIEGFSDFHNAYLQQSVSIGVVGLGFFLWMFYTLYRNLTDNQSFRTLGSIMLGLWLCYMLVGNFPSAYLTVLFALLSALVLKHPNDVFRNSVVQ